MIIVVDESVSFCIVPTLRALKHRVFSISEISKSGLSDESVYSLARRKKALLITRDYHFTNPYRFSPRQVRAILYIRHGNLTSPQEEELVLTFLEHWSEPRYGGKLITLYRYGMRVR